MPDPYRILITGSRSWADQQTIYGALLDAIGDRHSRAPLTQPVGFPCMGCAHCGCDPNDEDDACYVCADCDDFADGNPE